MNEPYLSVVFITYNHERYIREALDSVLMQETDFPFEIVVGEDCSTDHTRDILNEYKEKYPDRIRLLYRDRNLGRPTLNVYQTAMECRGKYIAFLEGDDFWTDPEKLKKQVHFLEEHDEYEAVTHASRLVGEDGKPLSDQTPLTLYHWSGDYTFEDFKRKPYWPGQTASVVTRNFWHDGRYDYTILYRAHDFIDDAVILLFMLLHGKIFRMEEEMSVWRYVSKDDGESWNSINRKRKQKLEDCEMKCTMLKWCEENVGLTEFGKAKAKSDFKYSLSVFLRNPSIRSFKMVCRVFRYNILHVTLGIGKVKMQ